MIFCLILGLCIVVLVLLAIISKCFTIYLCNPKEQNPLEGKRVKFVNNETEAENADGERGHLEAIGESKYKGGFYETIVKRTVDVVLSFLALFFLSPIFLIISIWIIIDDPGPVFFTQKRIGKNKRYFKMHKFRSMKKNAPHEMPTHMLDDSEQYITRAGKFLRSHSIDEIPQIWDIFIGNMSLVGPRPALWNQDLLTSERDKYGANDIKPGLTGWAQINGRDAINISSKAKLDGHYAKKIGLKMDVKCIIRTMGLIFYDKNIVEGKQ